MSKDVVYKGKVYSRREFAKMLGISDPTAKKYLEEYNGDAEKIAEILSSKTIYFYKDKQYTSMAELSSATGIDRRTLTKLIDDMPNREGNIINVDELVEIYYGTKITYTYQGIEYKTIKEAAKAVKMNHSTLAKYLKLANNDMEKAMELFYEEHTYYTDNGIRYTSQKDLADALGVTQKTLRKYIDDMGSIEKAVQVIRNRVSEEYEWRNTKYESFASLAKAMGIPTITLKRILEKETNGNLDKAYEIYQERNAGKYYGYTYEGIEYDSIKEVLKAYGLTAQRYYKKIKENNGDFKKTIDELIQEKEGREEEKRQRDRDEDERERAKERRKSEKEKTQYIFGGVIYHTKAAVSKASGISETQVRRLIEKYGNNLDIALQGCKEIVTYTYDGKTFDSIKALAKYTGKNELRLGRYLRKYNRDAEKAIFMMNLRDSRMKKNVTIPDSKMSLQDKAIILGIKYSELVACLNSGMTIEDIKESIIPKSQSNLKKRSSTIMYDNSTSLVQYCIDNGLNYSCIYYAINEYGKTPQEAIENYKKNGQKIPKTWIFEKYGILLKHLLLSENISSTKVVAIMRKEGIPLNEAIERCIIRDYSRERDLDTAWQQEIYYFLTMENFSEEDREAFIKEFYVTEDELDCVDAIKSKVDVIERKKLLFEFAECIKNKVFPQEELVELMHLYEITNDEIDTIYLELYTRFKSGVLLSEEETETIKTNTINAYIRNWGEMTDEQKAAVRKEIPEEYEYIVKVFDEICFCKNLLSALQHDQDVKDRMRTSVYIHVGTNDKTRNDLQAVQKKIPESPIV